MKSTIDSDDSQSASVNAPSRGRRLGGRPRLVTGLAVLAVAGLSLGGVSLAISQSGSAQATTVSTGTPTAKPTVTDESASAAARKAKEQARKAGPEATSQEALRIEERPR